MSENTIEQTPVVAQPETPPQKPVVQVDSLPENALKARLDQAKATGRNDLLKELGVSDPSQLKAALDAIKEQEDAAKTTADKLAELAQREQEANLRLQSYQSAIESVWQVESAKLSPEQLAAIESVAGNDAAAKVRALNALQSTWRTQSQPVVTAPANTAPPANAPPPTNASEVDHKAVHDTILKTHGPIAAARYLVANERAFIQ